MGGPGSGRKKGSGGKSKVSAETKAQAKKDLGFYQKYKKNVVSPHNKLGYRNRITKSKSTVKTGKTYNLGRV